MSYGRKVVLNWDGAQILGVREKSLSLNGEAVNVTSDENDGAQTLLSEDAETSVTIELSGITKSNVLRKAKKDGGSALTKDVTITYPDGFVISGTFRLGSYTEGQPYNEAVTFTATLMSTGAVFTTYSQLLLSYSPISFYDFDGNFTDQGSQGINLTNSGGSFEASMVPSEENKQSAEFNGSSYAEGDGLGNGSQITPKSFIFTIAQSSVINEIKPLFHTNYDASGARQYGVRLDVNSVGVLRYNLFSDNFTNLDKGLSFSPDGNLTGTPQQHIFTYKEQFPENNDGLDFNDYMDYYIDGVKQDLSVASNSSYGGGLRLSGYGGRLRFSGGGKFRFGQSKEFHNSGVVLRDNSTAVKIDNFAIFDRAFTQEEVTELYAVHQGI